VAPSVVVIDARKSRMKASRMEPDNLPPFPEERTAVKGSAKAAAWRLPQRRRGGGVWLRLPLGRLHLTTCTWLSDAEKIHVRLKDGRVLRADGGGG